LPSSINGTPPRDLNRSKHRAVHASDGDEVTAEIDDGDVHFPVPLFGLCNYSIDGRLSAFQ
jgi:hypothetical protein